ncbi:site-specific integrase [Saccharicrinis aurantiacus]|uniref:site-specific integrase n=1 Tax=Saccharicrinis aurantiacus TaxID=1849719 RepID=UPI00094F6DDD|nr:site-specific integrase [Saccharicrinis aurantiacus]
MGNKVSTSIVLYKSQTKKNGKHPAKLRITYNRKQMYYSIDTKDRIYEFTPSDFEKVRTPKPRGLNKDIQLEFSMIETKAQKIIGSMNDFSFKQFKSKFGIAGGDLSNILFFFKRRIKEFEDNGQVCSRGQYMTAQRTLQKYFNTTTRLDFREITVNELEKYERWMLDRDLSMSSVHNYMVPVRTIFKIAHNDGTIPRDLYPFGIKGYKIPQGQNIKKALKINEIEKIYNFECEYLSDQDKARDLWLFSYLLNGANINDIARLKFKNINKDFIIFIRHKTLKTSKNAKPISVPYTEELRRLIEKWGNKDRSPSNYIFDILKHDLSPYQTRCALNNCIKRINRHIKNIANEIGIDKHITTYTARHSFSTVLKRSGISTEFIGESLGHNDLKTTELYLDSFEDDMKRDVAKHLTAF